jgi:hypothetical protein
MTSIVLKEAVELWQMTTPLEGQHLSESVLDELIEGKSNDAVFDHLALCNWCRQRVWALQESSAMPSEADDYVLPLAANVGIPHEATWITADEKYKIEFRRMVADETQRAVLIVRVQPPFDFAGKTIVIRDANQRTLLRGRISEDGKVAAIVDEIDHLVLKKLTITED